MDVRADVLARLLVLQSVIGQLPDGEVVFSFLGRGLEDVPGVSRARRLPAGPRAPGEEGIHPRFPLQVGEEGYGELVLDLSDPAAFAPYRQYVHNLAMMVAMILDGRRLEALQREHARELERRVEERTRSLRHEIAERQQAERRAQEAQRRAERYLEVAEAMILELDRDGRVSLINDRGCALLGRSQEEVLGQDWFALALPAAARQPQREAFARALAGDPAPAHQEGDIVDRQGRILRISWHNTLLLDADGTARGILGSGIDITARKRAEEERDHLNGLLHQREKMDAIGQLAGGIAHDFNNQLSVISGFGELLLEQTADPAQQRRLRLVLAAAQRSADLTRQLLSFARRAPLAQERIDLHALVQELAEMLRRSIDRRIEVVLDLRASNRLDGDPSRLQNALLNLCLNARDAMPEGGRLRLATADLRLDRAGRQALGLAGDGRDWVEIAVSDTGSGMTEEVRARIFEPFFTTKGPGKGTGLGLATVHGTIHQMGGGIAVDSAPGRGTCFRLALPAGSLEAAAPAAPAAGRQQGIRALVVDDEEPVRAMLCELLARHGHRATGMADGASAIAWYRDHAEEADLVLLDLNMPRMGGVEVLRQLRAIDPAARIAVLTGNAGMAMEAGVLALGAVAVLEKPLPSAAIPGLVRHARATAGALA